MKRWYTDISDWRAKEKLVVLMRNDAGGYKSEEITQFLNSNGVRNHFSTPKIKWQNGATD